MLALEDLAILCMSCSVSYCSWYFSHGPLRRWARNTPHGPRLLLIYGSFLVSIASKQLWSNYMADQRLPLVLRAYRLQQQTALGNTSTPLNVTEALIALGDVEMLIGNPELAAWLLNPWSLLVMNILWVNLLIAGFFALELALTVIWLPGVADDE
ncbi:uncharacterized protein BO66DRAFT_444229 [Aspergillus aculeatinus CBS 121060]|uniref:Uncharacterized protein n=1 Tax=Aspergillus aculeatinus CBS 121060 TaxID=1448322 RepID=A0ACD1GSE7_9EURO|nr:hypothetical protein BO66DRAFT_444229 [Aspergillus aculeatinus CBS 121060]RAH64213.1 hypothetical protein BO66DRAFT_444229 [Aspergillus aculeatinus CBS 121060]